MATLRDGIVAELPATTGKVITIPSHAVPGGIELFDEAADCQHLGRLCRQRRGGGRKGTFRTITGKKASASSPMHSH
jgi:hypothetical protein